MTDLGVRWLEWTAVSPVLAAERDRRFCDDNRRNAEGTITLIESDETKRDPEIVLGQEDSSR